MTGLQVQDLITRFQLDNRAQALAPGTVDRYYGRALEGWSRWLGPLSLESLDREHLLGYLVHCREKGLAPKTVRNYHGAVRRLLRWALEEGYLTRDPFAGMRTPKVPKRTRKVPHESELRDLLAGIGPRCPLRGRAILLLVLDGALRLDEVRTLRLLGIDRSFGLLRVIGKGDKERTVSVGPRAVRALIDYLDLERPVSESPYVFLPEGGQGELLSWRALEHWFQRLKARTGFAWRFHDLRHWSATMSALDGMNPWELKERLGHGQISTTDIYVNLAGELRDRSGGRSATDRLFRAQGKGR